MVAIYDNSEMLLDLDDSELLELGRETIKPLLSEDWDSHDDDIWDTL